MKKGVIGSLVFIIIILISSIYIFFEKSNNIVPPMKENNAEYRIALLLSGSIDDKGWNFNNYYGMRKVNARLGLDIKYRENVEQNDYERIIEEYAKEKYDLILLAGHQFDEPVSIIAPDFPNTVFCVINGERTEGKNVAPVVVKEYEASYLASLIGGNITKNGKLATIGDFPRSATEKLIDTYEKKSLEIVKERKLVGSNIRTYTNSWNDIKLGKLITEELLDKGVDTIFVYSHDVDIGVVEIAEDNDIKVIDFMSDRVEKAPDTIAASILIDFDKLYNWILNQYLSGELKGSPANTVGIKEDVFEIKYSENIPGNIKEIVNNEIINFNPKKIKTK